MACHFKGGDCQHLWPRVTPDFAKENSQLLETCFYCDELHSVSKRLKRFSFLMKSAILMIALFEHGIMKCVNCMIQ